MAHPAEVHLQSTSAAALADYLDLLRIPSISSLPANVADVQRAAEWVAARLRRAGLENVTVMPTGGHPVVYADWLHAPGAPTVLIYGHFDVQPVDPLELWDHPPFEPTVVGDRVYARGASDMKGNLLMGIFAMEALLATDGRLPANVKCLYEGQEEIGSPQLPAFVEANRDHFACDVVINGDGGQESEEQPALGVGTKGIAGLQIDVHGANGDLHSGIYGGPVPNPLAALARIIASFRDGDNRILVPGFYDAVVPLTDADRASIAAVPFDISDYQRRLGVAELVPEPGYTPAEHLWARPTLEINGLWGGFQGDGLKTVLPAQAHAKVTCRLVPNQEPEVIRQLLIDHIRAHTPRGARVEIQLLETGSDPYVMPRDHWGNQAAAAVLMELYGREPYYVRSGGSVPVLALFLKHLNAHSVSFGFSLDDEQIHAPNEFGRLKHLERGPIAYVRLLQRLASAKR